MKKILLLLIPLNLTFACVQNDNKKKVANTTTTTTIVDEPLVEGSATLALNSEEDLEKYLGSTFLEADCLENCLLKELTAKLFSPADSFLPTDDLFTSLEAAFDLVPAKAIELGEKRTKFALGNSILFAPEDEIEKQGFDGACGANIPLAANDILPAQAELLEMSDAGTETFEAEKLQNPKVISDIKASGKVTNGEIPAETPIEIQYTTGQMEVQKSAEYKDYLRVKAGYALDLKSNIVPLPVMAKSNRSLTNRSSNRTFSWTQPAHTVLVPNEASVYPVRGYGNDQNAFNPKDDLCKLDPVIEKFAVDPVASAIGTGSPWRKGYETVTPFHKLNGGYKAPKSPRAVRERVVIQCNQRLPEEAAALGLGSDWKIEHDMDFFITDLAWPGCGANCQKEERTTELDFRWEDVEPARNRCVDRWAGMSNISIKFDLQQACMKHPGYLTAVRKDAQIMSNTTFASDCLTNPFYGQCHVALSLMKELAKDLSVEKLETAVTLEEIAKQEGRITNTSHIVNNPLFSNSNRTLLATKVDLLETYLPIVQDLAQKQSPAATWVESNQMVHGEASLSGFNSLGESNRTVLLYKSLLERIKKLREVEVRQIGCEYDVKGKFRKYENSQISSMKILPIETKTSLVKLKESYSVPK